MKHWQEFGVSLTKASRGVSRNTRASRSAPCQKFGDTKIWAVLWLVFFSWLVFLHQLGSIGLIDETEPLFAEAAREMLSTGDWITPHFNGEVRFDKPPLIYWLMAGAYQVVGVNEWGARLPSALSAIALTVFLFYTLRRPWPHTFGWAAMVTTAAYVLNLEVYIWGRLGVSDMLLSACVGSALLAFFLGYTTCGDRSRDISQNTRDSRGAPTNWWYLAFYVLVALAVLAKGPVGLALPVLVVGAFAAYTGQIRQLWWEMRPAVGIPIFLAIAVPWYVLVIWANGSDYVEMFFGYHNIERFTNVVNDHAAPWYFYFAVLLVGFAPWSSYLPAAIAKTKFWKRRFWQRQDRHHQLGLFAFFWLAAIFLFFSAAATKLPSYILPAMGGAAILVGLLFADFQNNRRSLFYSGIFNIVLVLAMAGVFFFGENLIGYDPAAPNLREIVVASGVLTRGGIVWLLTAVLVVWLLWFGFAHRKWYRQLRWLWVANFLGFVAFIALTLTPALQVVDEARQQPIRQMAEMILQVRQPDEEVIMTGFEKPSLVFYIRHPVEFITVPEEIDGYLQKRESLPSALILGNPSRTEDVEPTQGTIEEVARVGNYHLIRYRLLGR